jgi:RNA polymerase sigma-70 factor, ECF subfamily
MERRAQDVSGHPQIRSDSDLMENFYQGDDSAFGIISQKFREPIRRFLMRGNGIQRQDAEDLVQETLQKALRTRITGKRFDPTKGSVKTWLFTFARNLYIDRNQARSKEETVDLNDPVFEKKRSTRFVGGKKSGLTSPLEFVECREFEEAFCAAFAALPLDDRDILILAHLGGLKLKEMAGLKEESISRLYQNLCQARDRLKVNLIARGWNCEQPMTDGRTKLADELDVALITNLADFLLEVEPDRPGDHDLPGMHALTEALEALKWLPLPDWREMFDEAFDALKYLGLFDLPEHSEDYP